MPVRIALSGGLSEPPPMPFDPVGVWTYANGRPGLCPGGMAEIQAQQCQGKEHPGNVGG